MSAWWTLRPSKISSVAYHEGNTKPEGRLWIQHTTPLSTLRNCLGWAREVRKRNRLWAQPRDTWLRGPSLMGRQRLPSLLQHQDTVLPPKCRLYFNPIVYPGRCACALRDLFPEVSSFQSLSLWWSEMGLACLHQLVCRCPGTGVKSTCSVSDSLHLSSASVPAKPLTRNKPH